MINVNMKAEGPMVQLSAVSLNRREIFAIHLCITPPVFKRYPVGNLRVTYPTLLYSRRKYTVLLLI